MEDSSCAICTESLAAKLAATVCGHVFHEHCLARWLLVVPGRKRACPQCRTDLPRTTSIRCLRPRDFTCTPLTAELTMGARGSDENVDAADEVHPLALDLKTCAPFPLPQGALQVRHLSSQQLFL